MKTKTERLEARISKEHDALLRWAASNRGLGVSAFVIEAAVERAEQMRAEEMLTRVPREHAAAFRAWLEEPPQDVPGQRALADAEPFEQR